MSCLLSVALSSALGASVCAAEGVDDVIKLSHAGISQDVMLAYVQSAPEAYDLSADEIQNLRNENVSATVIVAMLDHGKELQGGAATPVAGENTSAAQLTNVNETTAAPASTASANDAPPSSAADDTVATVVAPPEQDTNLSFFYEAMAPHGRWHQTAAGWAWQPAVAETEAGWRPYANSGHWVWTDQGWYWESGYPWGWAAFHYGRWNDDASLGWVWVPDNTWGPAWVSWRQGEQYYGWAPLPVDARFEAGAGFSFHNKNVGFSFDFGVGENDWAFVPADRFLDAEIGIAVVPRAHVRDVFRQTTIVNNTYVYNDNRVINNGVPVSQAAQRTNRSIDPVRLADAHFAAGTPIRGEVRTREGITVYRPAVAAVAPRDPKRAVAHSVYLRREPAPYPMVTASAERNAQRRLAVELSQRHAPKTPLSTAERSAVTAPSAHPEHDEAAQHRLDAELAARERVEHSLPARPANDERAVNEALAERAKRESADREKAERAIELRDDKHADKDSKKDKHHKGDD